MTTLLVLTAGQADVQLAIDGVRRELNKDLCAALHDEIESRGYVLGDAPVQKGQSVHTLPEGELIVCTPKLDAVLRDIVPAAALVLETRRNTNSSPGDPRFAGAALEARLKTRGVETVYRLAYLEGTERVENRDQPRDAVIRREVVHRLEQAVHDTLHAANPGRIVVAATGGFPVITNLVEEIVRLHAAVPVETLEVADGTRASPPSADRAIPRTSIPEPITSFQARRRVLDLIEKGNLLGAWAVAEPLHADEIEHPWTQVVEWLARFASSLPIPPGCDIAVLKHQRMAVRAAIRVELALRAGDVPRAVQGTVAFFEAALWDRVLEHFDRDPTDIRWLTLRDGAVAPAGKLLRDTGKDDKNRPFERKERPDGGTWFWFHESGAGRFARDYIQSPPLKSLVDAVEGIKALRNDVAHSEPTPELMINAHHQMQDAALWSAHRTFLGQPLVHAVLRELGEPEPGTLLDNVLAEVRRRLVTLASARSSR